MRDQLRTWQYYKERSYFTLDPTDGKNQDVVTMIPRLQRVETTTRSVPVMIMGPGMLFDSLSPAGGAAHKPQPDEEIWATGVTNVPEVFASGRPNIPVDPTPALALVSWPGFVAQPGVFQDVSLTPVDEGSDTFCSTPAAQRCVETGLPSPNPQWVNAPAVEYQGCFATSNDGAPGMSGGGAVVLRSVQEEPERLRIVGLHHGATPGAMGVEPHWSFDTLSTDSPVAGHVLSRAGTSENFRSTATQLTPEIASDASRDYDYDLRLIPDDVVESLRPFGVEGAAGRFYQPGSDVPAGCDVSVDPKCADVVPAPGDGIGAAGRTDLVTFSCRDIYSVFEQDPTVRIANGYALGFIGEVTRPYVALDFAPDAQLNNPDLASIHVICAPWSSAQWSINWQDLVFWGKQRPDAGVLRHA